jgi:hypothetical protein
MTHVQELMDYAGEIDLSTLTDNNSKFGIFISHKQ